MEINRSPDIKTKEVFKIAAALPHIISFQQIPLRIPDFSFRFEGPGKQDLEMTGQTKRMKCNWIDFGSILPPLVLPPLLWYSLCAHVRGKKSSPMDRDSGAL